MISIASQKHPTHLIWRLEIEEGRVMRFVLTPTNKLPEALSAFDPLTGSLFTGKFFSAHKAVGKDDSPVDTPGIAGWEDYVEENFGVSWCAFWCINHGK